MAVYLSKMAATMVGPIYKGKENKRKSRSVRGLENWKDGEKYQRIVPKPHAHLHSMQKTFAKVQNNWGITVRGIVPTKYPLSIHFDSISCKKRLSSQSSKSEKKLSKYYYN